MINVNVQGKDYPAELNMLGMMELEELLGGDLNEFQRSLSEGKHQLKMCMMFLFATINTTAEAKGEKRPFEDFKRFCSLFKDLKSLQGLVAEIYADGMASTSIEDDPNERDVFLE